MSYSSTPPPPPGYGNQPPYGAPAPQRTSVMSILALVTGILAVIPCFWGCLVFAIGATVLGIFGKKDVDQSGGAKKGRGMAQAGFIMGLIGIALGVVYWILVATGVIDISYDFDN